jgi:hypothetical protein
MSWKIRKLRIRWWFQAKWNYIRWRMFVFRHPNSLFRIDELIYNEDTHMITCLHCGKTYIPNLRSKT